LSNVIKKTRIESPISIPLGAPDLLEDSNTKDPEDRSLEFSRTVSKEIGRWLDTFRDRAEDLRKDTEERIERSWNEGHEEGFEKGLLHERSERIVSIDLLLGEAKRKKEQAVRDLEVRVIELAVNIAERIIGRTLSANPEIVADIIGEAISQMISGEKVVLKVSEEDMEFVKSRYEQLLGMTGNAREFRIEADRRLRRGDCVIETEGGMIDATLSSRLDFLVEELIKHG
jgi:flagellar biosynthesis/type III secretory pathway protein FliH